MLKILLKWNKDTSLVLLVRLKSCSEPSAECKLSIVRVYSNLVREFRPLKSMTLIHAGVLVLIIKVI